MDPADAGGQVGAEPEDEFCGIDWDQIERDYADAERRRGIEKLRRRQRKLLDEMFACERRIAELETQCQTNLT